MSTTVSYFLDRLLHFFFGMTQPRQSFISCVKMLDSCLIAFFLVFLVFPPKGVCNPETLVSASEAVIDLGDLPQGVYIFPNETKPQDGAALFQSAPVGSSYLSFGTVRGFIGAYLSRAGSLLLIDMDSGVTLYNRIEVALLAMSDSHEDYKKLRFEASREEWVKRANANGVETSILTEPHTWSWWKRRVRDNPDFSSFHQAPRKSPSDQPFDGVNYIYHEPVYRFLARMAKSGLVIPLTANIEKSEDVDRIVSLMVEKRFRVGSVDISNAYPPYGIGGAALMGTIKKLMVISHQEARLLMYNFRSYAGYTFKQLLSSASKKEVPWVIERLELGFWPEKNSLDDSIPARRCGFVFVK